MIVLNVNKQGEHLIEETEIKPKIGDAVILNNKLYQIFIINDRIQNSLDEIGLFNPEVFPVEFYSRFDVIALAQ